MQAMQIDNVVNCKIVGLAYGMVGLTLCMSAKRRGCRVQPAFLLLVTASLNQKGREKQRR